MDFFIRAEPDNARSVLDALEAFGFGDVGLSTEDLVKPGQVIQLGRPPNRIDILTSISGVEFDAAWKARVPSQLDGEAVNFLGLDDLIENKRASGRDQDLADVRKLLAVAAQKKRGKK
jgi:hypothetical protein